MSAKPGTVAVRDIKPANVTVTATRKVVEDPAGYDALVQLVASMLDRRRRSGSR